MFEATGDFGLDQEALRLYRWAPRLPNNGIRPRTPQLVHATEWRIAAVYAILAPVQLGLQAYGLRTKDRSNAMSTITTTHPAALPGTIRTPPPIYRLTVDEYERIGEMLDDRRVELIDGYMVEKMAKNPEHCWSTKQVFKALERLLPAGWTWRTGAAGADPGI